MLFISDNCGLHVVTIGRMDTIGTLSIGKLAIQLPLLLRKPCKLFASVERVCQRRMGFLVFPGTRHTAVGTAMQHT